MQDFTDTIPRPADRCVAWLRTALTWAAAIAAAVVMSIEW